MPTADDPRIPDELLGFLDRLPEPVVEPDSRLPVWALKLIDHYFGGGDVAAVPGADEGVHVDADGEHPMIDFSFEGVGLRFEPRPGQRVRTFVLNDSPHRPSAFAEGARVDSALMFHEEPDGPHALFEFDGVEAQRSQLFAVDDQGVRDAAALAAELGTAPWRCPGTLCIVWPGEP